MLRLAWDDTDSRAGGCSTALVEGVRALFPELRPDGPARLVRLNPNVPWKTRGNGAVALEFTGDLPQDVALERLWAFVQERAQPDPATSAGCVVASAPLPSALYDAAVSRLVTREETETALADAGAAWAGGRGVIGAAAALAWPARRATWELIAYREARRVGLRRAVDDARVRAVELSEPSVFDSYDLVEDEVVCVPASPCPVLWGLRGTDPDALARAAPLMGPEPAEWKTLFLTNQASDDHLRDLDVADVRAFGSARVAGRVRAHPVERGGHVFLEVEDATGALRCAAYAPTRSFRRLALALREGDRLLVAGGVHEGPDGRLTLGVEKLRLDATAPRKTANPWCPGCGRRMGSAGRGAGYRCRGSCGTRADAPETQDAALALGWHEVPACARRHLARPLRLGVEEGQDAQGSAALDPRAA